MEAIRETRARPRTNPLILFLGAEFAVNPAAPML